MKLFPLILGTQVPAEGGKGKTPDLKSITEKTLKRDDYTCRFCGFRAKQYQRLVPCAEAGDPPYATA
ncbi:hypothetical protein ACSTKV_22915, partial [Vibrio parahaemolyticus]